MKNHFLKATISSASLLPFFTHIQNWLNVCTHSNHCIVHDVVPHGVQLQHQFSYSIDYYCACAPCSKLSESAQMESAKCLAVERRPEHQYYVFQA